jgi:hypothetical protein
MCAAGTVTIVTAARRLREAADTRHIGCGRLKRSDLSHRAVAVRKIKESPNRGQG